MVDITHERSIRLTSMQRNKLKRMLNSIGYDPIFRKWYIEREVTTEWTDKATKNRMRLTVSYSFFSHSKKQVEKYVRGKMISQLTGRLNRDAKIIKDNSKNQIGKKRI